MAANQGKKAGEERASRRSIALPIQGREFGYFEKDEGKSQQPGDEQCGLRENLVSPGDRDGCQAAAEAGCEQARRFPGDAVEIEYLARARTAGRVRREHRIGREEAGENDDVRQEKEPEAVADDDPYGRRAPATVAARQIRPAMAEAIQIRNGNDAVGAAHCHSTSPVVRIC